MLSGFNTNIRHRSVLFHVQTEDSGRQHPHIISHLYYHGTIIASKKSGYAALLEGGNNSDEEISVGVRKWMQEQHKNMLRRLREGFFDQTIVEVLGKEIFSDAPAAEVVRNEQTKPVTADKPPAPRNLLAELKSKTPISSSSTRVAPAAVPSPQPRTAGKRSPRQEFGEDVLSEKPLDEVVFDFLVENARKKPAPQ